MKRIWNNGMALLLTLAMLLPMLGMVRPVMAAEVGDGQVAEVDTDVTEAAEQYGPQMEAAETADGSQGVETPIVTAFTTYAEPQGEARDDTAPAGGQEANAAAMVPGRKGMVFGVRKANRARATADAEDSSFRLPKTGGAGIAPVYAAGGTLALCGCAALMTIRKRKDEDV